MDSPLVRVLEKYKYQKTFAVFVIEAGRGLEGPGVVALDLLILTGERGQLYFVSNWAYWSRKFYFKVRIRERQNLFGECRMLNCAVCLHPRGQVAIVLFRVGRGVMNCRFCYLCRRPWFFSWL